MGIVKKFRKRARSAPSKAEGLLGDIKQKLVPFVDDLVSEYENEDESADAAAMIAFLDESVQFLLHATGDDDGIRRAKFLALCAARYDAAVE